MNAARLDSLFLSRKWNRARDRARGQLAGDVRYIELRDAIVRVKVAGSGSRTLIVTPDPPNVIEHYDELYRVMGGDLRIVCFELPGFGHSVPRSGYGFSLEENARVIAEVIERVANGPSVLGLSCVAGLAGMLVARERPELVSHVVAVQTPSLEQELRWAARVDRRGVVRAPIVGQIALALGRRALAKGWYRAALGDAGDVPRYTDVALRALDEGGAFSLASGLQGLGRARPSSFGVVEQPALAIWGTKDRSHERTDRRSTLEYMPSAQLVEMGDAGHFPDLEQPATFREAVVRFLAQT